MTRQPMAFPRWLLVKYDLTTDEFKKLPDEKQEALKAEHNRLRDEWYEQEKAVQSAN
ncbi:hypothetical protein NHG29_01650 [Aerococcaceae bacterium NML160702]|nr:hypothetical protein [Aerococcaceae bacterium NML160702]